MSAPKDLKKETGIATEGSQVKDRVAYKQCVEQQKRMRSTNPWAMCNSQFGVGKSEDEGGAGEDMEMVEKSSIVPGKSFLDMKKKESNALKTNHSDPHKSKNAQNQHLKPTGPQIKGQKPKKVALAPAFKSELEPRMSWAALKKMQTAEDLAKKPPKKD